MNLDNAVLTFETHPPNMRGRIYKIIIVHQGGKEWKMKNMVKNGWPLA